MAKLVYIVSCYCPMEKLESGTMFGAEERYHIHSVWTSPKKAEKECSKLNSEEMAEWREEYGYGLFTINPYIVSK